MDSSGYIGARKAPVLRSRSGVIGKAAPVGQPWCMDSTHFRDEDHLGERFRAGKSDREMGGVSKAAAAIVTTTIEPMSALSSESPF